MSEVQRSVKVMWAASARKAELLPNMCKISVSLIYNISLTVLHMFSTEDNPITTDVWCGCTEKKNLGKVYTRSWWLLPSKKTCVVALKVYFLQNLVRFFLSLYCNLQPGVIVTALTLNRPAVVVAYVSMSNWPIHNAGCLVKGRKKSLWTGRLMLHKNAANLENMCGVFPRLRIAKCQWKYHKL